VPEYVKRATAPRSTVAGDPDVAKVVSEVIADVRERGDAAVRHYSEKFDRWSPPEFRLSPEEIERIVASADPRVLDDIRTVQGNVRDFAQHQRDSLADFEVEAQPGVFLGQRSIPVGSVGAYVPGGRYPLVASAHMTVTTATVAGVEKIIACTPPIRGEIPVTTVAAMHLAGATDILLLGGVQAIAALAVGTATIPRVDLIAGPGNAYVAEAKRQLFGEIGIDLLAGPTEILVIADAQADPFVVAVDLLSQAEHGPDSPAVLITTSGEVARQARQHIEALLPGMPTRGLAEPAWRDHGQIIVVGTLAAAYRLADELAFEHVEVLTEHPREALDAMRNYGALFLGEGTCVSYGDKVIGTNHTLPTRRTARHTGGLWVGKYLKTVTYQEVTDPAASAALGELCGRASRVEQFEGHARSGDVRSAKFGGAKFGRAQPGWINDAMPADRR
jgi:sulfopropanediol 3-dehydrogenase